MATPTCSLVERLLNEEEGVALDFKRDQYPFVGATDDDKSELLKDILAFANSWRRADAYILIGVEDVKGGRGNILGVASHLDDAQLQQFVNSKVQRPLRFAYAPVRIDGKEVGVIHIPSQERPLYLNRDFGRLSASAVYIRRGSSTDLARPDEVARMGRGEDDESDIVLDVFFADPGRRAPVTPAISSVVLTPPNRIDIPDYKGKRDPYGINMRTANGNYFRELVRFTCLRHLLAPVHLGIRNTGRTTAHDVRIEARIAGADAGVVVMDDDEFPEIPQPEYELVAQHALQARRTLDLDTRRVEDAWLIQARADKVQPEAAVWLRDPFYLGSRATTDVTLEITVFADNLPVPHRQTLNVPITATSETVDLARIAKLEEERFGNSPEHRAFLRERGWVDDPDPLDPV